VCMLVHMLYTRVAPLSWCHGTHVVMVSHGTHIECHGVPREYRVCSRECVLVEWPLCSASIGAHCSQNTTFAKKP